MTKKEFGSQVCTTLGQSERLLEMGLGKASADMVWMKELAWDEVTHCTYDADTFMLRPIDYLEGESHREHIPAWSLHRLIEIASDVQKIPISFVNWMHSDVRFDYDHLIDVIQWLIERGYINEVYLED